MTTVMPRTGEPQQPGSGKHVCRAVVHRGVTSPGSPVPLSYLLRRGSWGAGPAFEAARAMVRAAAGELPAQPVLVVTQTANERSLKLAARLGFQRMGTFEAHDAEQAVAVADLHSFKARSGLSDPRRK